MNSLNSHSKLAHQPLAHYLCRMNNHDRDNWFEAWFDSPYYHMLYAHRDTNEADTFVRSLQGLLNLPAGARILDLACGKGRHSKALSLQGYAVCGVDLSERSIAEAKKSETDNLEFMVHDMRRPVAVNYFDAVLNLFTSFGYFQHVHDNVRTIEAVHSDLKAGGIFLLDYFNAVKVKKAIAEKPEGDHRAGDVLFHWQKSIVENAVVKRIEVTDQGRKVSFSEHVQLFTREDFARLLETRFEIVSVFGDYSLSPFDEETSDRLIVFCRKK